MVEEVMNRNVRGILSLLFLAAGLYCGWLYSAENNQAEESKKYLKVMGVIDAATVNFVHLRQSNVDNYYPDLKYHYTVAGKQFVNHRISFPEPVYHNRAAAEAYAAKYPLKSEVYVYYDGKNPEKATLVEGSKANLTFQLALTVLLFLGSAAMGWRYFKANV